MAERKSFLVRIDEKTFEALRRWADEDLRSLNGQIEFLLRRALVGSGRLKGENKPGALSDSPVPMEDSP
jgi:hypothetical protein